MGNSGSPSCGSGMSSLHLSCDAEQGIVFESRQWNQASRHIEGGVSRSFSSCGKKPWVPSTCDGDVGSFSGCLWKVRNTVELGGASRISTGFGAMKEGLISS